MMSNLFSSFDPSTNLNLSLNWTSSMLGLIFVPMMFWIIPNRFSILIFNIMYSLHMEFKMLTKKNSSTLIFIALFYFILMNNFLGLFPYIFTSSSHLIFNLFM